MSGRYSKLGTRYSNLPSEDEKIQPSQSILDRALGSIGRQAGQMFDFPQQSSTPRNPFEAGLSAFGKFRNPFMGPKVENVESAITSGLGETATDIMGMKEPISKGIVSTGINIIPQAIIGAKMSGVSALGKGIANAGRKSAGWYAKPFQKVSEIQKFKSQGMSDIAQEALQSEAQVAKSGGLKKQVTQKLYGEEPLSGISSQTEYLEKSIPKATHQESLKLQKELPALYGRKSKEFGNKLSELIGDKPVEVPVSEIQPALKQSLLEHGILKFDEAGNMIPARSPISKNETKLFNMYRNFEKGLSDNVDIVTDASDLIKAQSSMKVPFGKAFKGDDMLMNTVKKNISGVLEKYVPGVKELRSSHAPFIQGKYASIKELSPFSGRFDTGKASGFLKKYAEGDLDPDQKSLIGFLEKELGRNIAPEAKAYGSRLSQMASKQKLVKSNLNEILSKVDQTIEDSITAIKSRKITNEKELQNIVDQMTRENYWSMARRGVLGTAVTATLGNYIFGKVLGILRRMPSEQ